MKTNGSVTALLEEKGGFCLLCHTQMDKKGGCLEVCPKCNWVNPKGCGG